METLLDTDLYKLTMMQAVWLKQPEAQARYEFINRRLTDRFSEDCLGRIRDRVSNLCNVKLHAEEEAYLRGLGLFRDDFLAYLRTFQLSAGQVEMRLEDGQLRIVIEGPWVETILWEVPLMAIISECYFEFVQTDWDRNVGAYFQRAIEKGRRLTDGGCAFADFGTRRRRSYAAHEAVVCAFNEPSIRCVGTSNVHFARKYGMRPIGTMAHEWIMAYAGLVGVRQANGAALRAWRDVYGDKLNTALTDTYTTDLFLEDFRGELAQAYGAVRQDSGDPLEFVDKMLRFYEEQGINARERQIVFSDGLNVDKALEIQAQVQGRFRAAYGIGTHFTNDFPDARALNMVIKLFAINGCPVAKISDDRGKGSGAPHAVSDALAAIDAALALN